MHPQTFEQRCPPIDRGNLLPFGQTATPLGELPVSFCQTSNIAFLDRCPTDDFYKAYYAQRYWHTESPFVVDRFQRRKSKVRAFKALSALKGFQFDNPDILEIGCGYGHIANVLHSKLGGTIAGVEPSDKSSVPLVGKWLSDLKPEPRYDIVAMFHVLEHMTNPLQAIERAASVLRPDGKLVIQVPNLEVVKSIGIKHPFSFSRRGLTMLLDLAGFGVQVLHAYPEKDVSDMTLVASRGRGMPPPEPIDLETIERNHTRHNVRTPKQRMIKKAKSYAMIAEAQLRRRLTASRNLAF